MRAPLPKVFITCAITGNLTKPEQSPHLPITPQQIAEAALEAAEAGASIIHLHARDPETGKPTPDPAVFMQFLPRIKQSTDAVVNITTGGAPTMSVQERVRPAETHQPEVAATFPRTITMKGGRVGLEGRDGAEYVVIGAEGVVHLPTHLAEQWPQGTLVRIEPEESDRLVVSRSAEAVGGAVEGEARTE